jgi:uncharacterized protein with GYD domain
MPKYMFKASLSEHGIKGTMDEGGTSRRQAVTQAVEAEGGKVEAFYYAFGDVDAYVIVDLPSAAHAVATAATVGMSGTGSVETVVIIEPETVDEAAKIHPEYRAPGEIASH